MAGEFACSPFAAQIDEIDRLLAQHREAAASLSTPVSQASTPPQSPAPSQDSDSSLPVLNVQTSINGTCSHGIPSRAAPGAIAPQSDVRQGNPAPLPTGQSFAAPRPRRPNEASDSYFPYEPNVQMPVTRTRPTTPQGSREDSSRYQSTVSSRSVRFASPVRREHSRPRAQPQRSEDSSDAQVKPEDLGQATSTDDEVEEEEDRGRRMERQGSLDEGERDVLRLRSSSLRRRRTRAMLARRRAFRGTWL